MALRADEQHEPVAVDGSYVVLLGSGPSSSVPLLRCLVAGGACAVCASAVAGPPDACPNWRTNPSLLVRIDADGLGSYRNVLIDCGKNFREQAIRFFPIHHVSYLDAIVLTHEHADAILGLDDVRSIQGASPRPIDVYADAKSLNSCRRIFPYLTGDTPIVAGVVRHVAALAWHEIAPFEPFTVAGLAIRPLPLIHGEDYVSLGFEFGITDRVVYLSDVSRVPERTMDHLRVGPPIALLFVDTLFRVNTHPTHFNFDQALELVRALAPRSAVLVGLTHELDYEPVNAELAAMTARGELPCPVELGRDGLMKIAALR